MSYDIFNMQHTVEMIISKQEIAQRITELGQAISEHYRYSSKMMMIGLLRGSFIFIADLCRAVSLSHEVDFITISSYGNKIKTGDDIKIIQDLADNIYGKDVIIVEDIIDSGNTIRRISDLLTLRHPKSLAICSLLDKPKRRQFHVIVDWVGFAIPDEFVVGYGMDYAQQYRNLPYIGKIVTAKI